MAGVTKAGNETVLTRTIRLGPSDKPLTVLVADDIPTKDRMPSRWAWFARMALSHLISLRTMGGFT